MKKLLIYLFAVLLLSLSVHAYSVTITWNFNQPNYDFETYRCADATCSAVIGGPILAGNSGASNSAVTTYSATGTNRTAFYFFPNSTDDLFRTKGFIVTTSGAVNTSVNDTFNKKNSCQSNVTDINTSPVVLDSGMNSTVNVTVNSPFKASDSAAGSPVFRPAGRANFFGADVIVNLTIRDASIGTVLFTGSQNVTLAEDEVRNVSFNWNNMPLANVTMTADTQVIDSQCNLANTLTHSRVENFTVLDLNNPPIANAGPDKTVGTNTTVTFDGSGSTDSDGFITTYFWDFGDNTNATGQIVTHNYTTQGNFTVILTVTDDDLATASDTALVQVDGIPTAVISGPSTGFTNQVLTFNGGQSTDDGNITNYNWTFGDGGTATGSIVTHTYTAVGTYNVILTVTDNNNLTDNDTLTVTITQQTSSGPQSSSSSRRRGSSSTNKHDVRISDVIMDRKIACGVPNRAQLQISNSGDFDERNIRVALQSQDLGIKDVSTINLDRDGERLADFTFTIPNTIQSGDYVINFDANFGSGEDVLNQNVQVECNPANTQEEIQENFVPSATDKLGTTGTSVSPLVITSIILAIIVVVLGVIYFLL